MRALDVLIEAFERQDIEPWAREGITSRLSSTFPPEGVAWCVAFMGRTAVSTPVGSMQTITCTDIRADVPKIACPTLVITTEGSGLATVDETRAWQPPSRIRSCSCCPGMPIMWRRATRPSACRRPWRSSRAGIQTTADKRGVDPRRVGYLARPLRQRPPGSLRCAYERHQTRTAAVQMGQGLGTLAYEVGHPLRDHDGRGVGIGPNHIGHHGRIRDA